jgi:hypothetical protein
MAMRLRTKEAKVARLLELTEAKDDKEKEEAYMQLSDTELEVRISRANRSISQRRMQERRVLN